MTTFKAAWSLKTTDFGNLARSGENGAEAITFDCAKVLEEYPDATIKCIIRRSGDTEPYPAELTASDSTRILTLRSVETAMEGTITIELRAVSDAGFVYKSAYYKGRILSSLSGEGDTPGEPIADILNTLEERAEAATTAATAAQTIADTLTAAKEAGEFNGKDGADGAPGKDGVDGTDGKDGVDGKDGKDGADGAKGEKGDPGADGYSPTATVTQTDTGATITITDASGTTTATVLNGAKGDKGDTGATGAQGEQGIQGIQGEKGDTGATGADGYSPTATVTKTGDTATITITDKAGTTSAEVKDGSDATVTKAAVVSALGYEPGECDLTHINSVIVDADNTKMVNILTDSSGNSFQLRRILFQITFPTASGDNSLYCGLGGYGWVAYCYVNTCTRILFDVQPAGGDAWYTLMYRSTTTGSTITYNTSTSTSGFVIRDGTDGIASGASCYSNTSIPTGTKIDIYGIRA